MDKKILNRLIDTSNSIDLNNTDYHVYNKNIEDVTYNNNLLERFNHIVPFIDFSNYLIIDFITTGSCVNNSEILAIHVLKINNNIIKDEFYSLINNNTSIPEYICKKHCLNINEIKKSKYLKDVKQDFFEFINSSNNNINDVNIIIKDNYNKIEFLLFNLSASNLVFNILDLSYIIKSNKHIYREAYIKNIDIIDSLPNKLVKSNYRLYFAYDLYKQV